VVSVRYVTLVITSVTYRDWGAGTSLLATAQASPPSTSSQPTNMLFPALVPPLLTARAALGPAHVPDGLPPWGAALLATVGKMEEKISFRLAIPIGVPRGGRLAVE
jgi:hypothetical protein